LLEVTERVGVVLWGGVAPEQHSFGKVDKLPFAPFLAHILV
jgi:hypothetical protein